MQELWRIRHKFHNCDGISVTIFESPVTKSTILVIRHNFRHKLWRTWIPSQISVTIWIFFCSGGPWSCYNQHRFLHSCWILFPLKGLFWGSHCCFFGFYGAFLVYWFLYTSGVSILPLKSLNMKRAINSKPKLLGAKSKLIWRNCHKANWIVMKI